MSRIVENFRKLVQLIKLKFARKQKVPQNILCKDFFRCEKSANILGFGFLKNHETPPSKLTRLNSLLFQLSIFLLFVLQVISFVMNVKHKLTYESIDNLFCSGVIIVILFKIYFVFYHNRAKICEVIATLDKHSPHSGVDQLRFKVHKYLRFLKLLEKAYSITLITIYFNFCSLPLVHQIYGKVKSIDVEWKLIMPLELPFDQFIPLNYGLINPIEAWICIFGIFAILSTDLLFACLMQILSMEFGILGQVISEINIENDEEAIKELKILVDIHQELIEASEKLEEIFSPLQLFNTFGSITALCTACFLAASGLGGYLIAKFFIFLPAVPFQIFIQCYYAQLLMDSSSSISTSAYSTEWFSGSIKFQRLILQVMVRAQKIQTITGWKFFDMSLEIFTWIMNTSYSYYSVLKGTYE